MPSEGIAIVPFIYTGAVSAHISASVFISEDSPAQRRGEKEEDQPDILKEM